MGLIHELARSLSDKTGTKFEVQYSFRRYGLKATRDGFSHVFQGGYGMTGNELKRWLASINDMVTMGFIPVDQLKIRE